MSAIEKPPFAQADCRHCAGFGHYTAPSRSEGFVHCGNCETAYEYRESALRVLGQRGPYADAARRALAGRE